MEIVKQKIRIGDLLIQDEVITEQQLQNALEQQNESGHRIGRVLVDLGYIEEEEFLNFLSRQLQIPFVDLRHYNFDLSLVHRLRESYARRYRAIILADEGGKLLLGMADPMDIFASDELERILQQPVKTAGKSVV